MMDKPKVLNYKKLKPGETGIVVMRPSLFSNPFRIGHHGDRDTVCDLFEDYVQQRPKLIEKIKSELKGKNLICCCVPLRCHADTLLRIANQITEEDC